MLHTTVRLIVRIRKDVKEMSKYTTNQHDCNLLLCVRVWHRPVLINSLETNSILAESLKLLVSCQLINPSTCIRGRVIVVDAFVCVCVCVCVLANKVTLSKLFSNVGSVMVSKLCWQLH